MRTYLIRRFLYMLLLLAMSSLLSFLVITLPPGDVVSHYANMMEQGVFKTEAELDAMRRAYGLDKPWPVQYARWVSRLVLKGDLGLSFRYNRPVREMIAERLPMTMLVSFATLVITYMVAFLGASMPDFLIALVIMLYGHQLFGISVGGLVSSEFEAEPLSWAKTVDILKHLPVPLLVIGLSGTAWLVRTMRAMLLDELPKPYVHTARAKGLKERRLLVKYPVRVALLPIVSTVGWALPGIFSGSTIVGIVLDLPTIGPLMFDALSKEDMYLAASCLLISCALTLIGTFISDMLMAWLDPRIRYE
jgi:peptide/nickel transport system permease protein